MPLGSQYYGTYQVTTTISTVPNLSGSMVVPDPNNNNNIVYTISGGSGQSVPATIDGNGYISFSINAGSPVRNCPFNATAWNPNGPNGTKVWSGPCNNGTPSAAGTLGTWRATGS